MNSVRYQDTKKSVEFYMPIKKYQKGKLEGNPICNCFKKNKYMGTNLTQDVKHLYLEDYKTLKKELEDGTNK